MTGISIPLWRVVELTHDAGDGLRFGMDAYPIFDESQRLSLNRKIIQHYWMRDIGLDSISLFTHFMRAKMNEIMPMYNKLYLSERIQFDPLATYDLETVRNGTAAEHSSRSSSGTNESGSGSKSRTVSGNTPQVPLSGRGDYASNFADANASTTANGKNENNDASTGSSSSNDSSRTSGFQGAASDLLNRYRSTILNLDMNVITDCADLFSILWEREQYTPTNWSLYR